MEYPYKITAAGTRFTVDGMLERLDGMDTKFELVEGRLFMSEEVRIRVLAMLLENVGIDQAIQLGDPEVWREAVDRIHGD